MFIIELTYTAPLAEIDAHMADHMAFLNRYYSSGQFVLSGRKIPRTGGIIIAVGNSRQEVESIAREDPFVARGLADVRVIEFRASQRADHIEQRITADAGKTARPRTRTTPPPRPRERRRS